MTTLIVHPKSGPLVGSVPVPSDKSITHRAILFAALCSGQSRLDGFAGGDDNLRTADALREMGVVIDRVGPHEIIVNGVGLYGLKAPKRSLECGNSGTSMRLLAGLLAGQNFQSTLIGDESLTKRPMMRVAKPLRMRGARIDGAPHATKPGEITAPLVVGPLADETYLGAIEYESPVSSAQVKSAILLSGLYAHGATLFREPTISRDHTERMMQSLGVPIRTMGTLVEIDPAGWDGKMSPFELTIPGDLSAAAFLIVAGLVVPGSEVTVRDVGVNPTRTGILEIVRDMGAELNVMPLGERGGEPVATLHVRGGNGLRAARVGGERVARAIDEIPIVCALAARSAGVTRIVDAAELRVKESDRIATMAHVLRAFGVRAEELADGLEIEGTDRLLTPVDVESRGDHRIAMTAAVLGLLASGPSTIRDAGCIVTSFPKFVATLRALGANIDVRE